MRLSIEPGGRQSANAAADHDQIKILLDCKAGDVERSTLATDLVSDLEGSWMAPPEAGQRRWIVACRFGAQLSERTQAAGDDECCTAKKVAAAYEVSHMIPMRCRSGADSLAAAKLSRFHWPV